MQKVTLLLTILCASTLYGMEREPGIVDLPWDVRHEIVKQAVESSKTVEDAIKAIKVACALQGACYDNLQDFTSLVGVLENAFPDMGRSEIAKKFNTAIANEYENLNAVLYNDFIYGKISIDSLKEKIAKGIDPNYTWDEGVTGFRSTLSAALSHVTNTSIDSINPNAIALVKLLLDAGANPNIKNYYNTTLFKSHQAYHQGHGEEDEWPADSAIVSLLKQYGGK